jgi:hypothetical protein
MAELHIDWASLALCCSCTTRTKMLPSHRRAKNQPAFANWREANNVALG